MQTMLITGATAGFGWEMTKLFSKSFKVIALGRRKKRLERLKNELGVRIIESDVNDLEKIKSLLDPNEIDVLINNAGLALGREVAQEAELNDWEIMINTNILGLVKLTHFILPYMVKKNSGHIVNIGSIAGNWPYKGGNIYGATKAFVKQFSLNLRADLFDKNVRVTNIEPGLAQSEFSIVRFKGDEDKARQTYEGANPLMPKDIADAVSYAINAPKHVNINRIELMPTTQACAGFNIYRKKENNE